MTSKIFYALQTFSASTLAAVGVKVAQQRTRQKKERVTTTTTTTDRVTLTVYTEKNK